MVALIAIPGIIVGLIPEHNSEIALWGTVISMVASGLGAAFWYTAGVSAKMFGDIFGLILSIAGMGITTTSSSTEYTAFGLFLSVFGWFWTMKPDNLDTASKIPPATYVAKLEEILASVFLGVAVGSVAT